MIMGHLGHTLIAQSNLEIRLCREGKGLDVVAETFNPVDYSGWALAGSESRLPGSPRVPGSSLTWGGAVLRVPEPR